MKLLYSEQNKSDGKELTKKERKKLEKAERKKQRREAKEEKKKKEAEIEEAIRKEDERIKVSSRRFHFKGIAQDHRFYCLRRVLASAWKVLAPCQFENLEKVNFEKFKVK